jgi:glycosyltransferase involved in cell wall biosynthesis
MPFKIEFLTNFIHFTHFDLTKSTYIHFMDNVAQNNKDNNSFDIVVFSHLRWEFVFQRPQHLITRISKNHKILFVEEPIGPNDSSAIAKLIKISENVTILQPQIHIENMINELPAIVLKYIDELGLNKNNLVLWFYSAAFVDMSTQIPHKAIVYDCMDELSLFRGAPQNLINQEKILLSVANIVFTGGKSLYEAKAPQNPNVHCFPSSVDIDHFEKALTDTNGTPEDIALPHPIVGFYGVIDERIDLELLDKLAEKMPDISFVMIGPVVKIPYNDLPKHGNIYYLGAKKYDELPTYLKKFDIAFMPFAMNESTKFISPTKTLEFMAAYKPIVSAPITDVVRDFSETVFIAKDAEEFEAGINQYLNETEEEKNKRIEKFKNILNNTSWDKTAEEMQKIISSQISSN